MMRRHRATGRHILQCAAVALALLGTPLRCAAQQGACSAGTTQASMTPGFFTGAELNSLTDDQLGMFSVIATRLRYQF